MHTDVCGPLENKRWDGKRFFPTVFDDFTHYTEVSLLKHKSEVQEVLTEFVQEAEAYMNGKVSKVRSDNGREYMNTRMISWTKNKGIEFDWTVPYTPQLNGKAERLNRLSMEKTRALLFDSKLNNEMWIESLYVATYLLNRSPTTDDEKPQ